MKITREQFDEWMDSPVTESVLQYLKDYRQTVIDDWAEKFAGGDFGEEKQRYTDYGYCLAVDDLSKIEIEDLEVFYDKGTGV